jgi:hypothetical protein
MSELSKQNCVLKEAEKYSPRSLNAFFEQPNLAPSKAERIAVFCQKLIFSFDRKI